MNSIETFLAKLRQKEVKLWLEGESLRFAAPKGVMNAQLKTEIQAYKPEIIAFLRENKVQSSSLIPVISRNQQLLLSFAQERLWFIDQLEGPSSAYKIRNILKIKGQLNFQALEKAIAFLFERHESLRTNFQNKAGKPRIIIKPNFDFSLPIINLENLAQIEREIEIENIISQQSLTAFDLEKDTLAKFTLIKLTPQSHLLITLIHHIIVDGWSMGILTQELSHLYQAYSQNSSPSLPTLSIQYVDFAMWQRQYLRGKRLSSLLNYWQQQLKDIPPLLELPTDKQRPQTQSFKGATESLTISSDFTQQLKRFSQENNVTLFITLLCVFGILLSRYSNQKDLIIGSPIANRNRQEIEGLIGFFVNTLPFRINLQQNLTFSELLQQVKTTAINVYEHQDLPFEKLVQELKVERNLSHNPLFQVLFALQNTPDVTINLEGLEMELRQAKTKTAIFDLSLLVVEKNEVLNCVWEYKTDLFNVDTIKRMTGHFETLLTAIISDPHQNIYLLPLLTKAEKKQILLDWNDTKVDYPQDKCIHQLFEDQVEKTPDAIAVVFKKYVLTYQQLNEKANQLAHYLQQLGVKPETLVGIFIERSLEMIIGYLAILKAGGGYVPLDPTYPPERLAYMLTDCAAPVLLTTESLLSSLEKYDAKIICWERDWHIIAQQNQNNPKSGVRAENLAYLIYTSGSTGKPKGVLIGHQGLLNLVFWHQRTFNLTSSDRASSIAGISFDASVWEIWPYLTIGASLDLINSEVFQSPEKLRDWLVSRKITISFIPTPLLEMLSSWKWPSHHQLRFLLTGGDKLNKNISELLPIPVINNYGPTENTVVSTSGLIASQPQEKVAPSIGRPIANTQIYILDQFQQPVPIGVTGEIYIAGDGLARGYLHQPQLTAAKFRNNPFGDGKIYQTGDLASYLPDGKIEFRGRIDHQVKIRGFRIELGEIETILNQHPAVRDAVVTVKKDIPINQYLIAYVIPSLNQSVDQNQLRDFLQQKLPQYMIPSAFVSLKTFPLTANGKVDLNSLPIPDSVRDLQTVDFVAPRNELERQLVKIWEQILNTQPIGIYDNFFEIGGNSLLTVRLVAEIEQTLHQKLPIAALFQLTTVEKLADVLSKSNTELRMENGDTISAQSKSSSLPELPIEDYRALLTTHAHWTSPRLGNKSLVLQTQVGNPQQKLPIFAVGGVGDMHYHLPLDQPVYSLPVHTHIKTPDIYIKALAALYVEEILIIQPTGPYILFGYCFGGTIALEIAHQLKAKGKEIAMLILVERNGFDTLYKYYMQIFRPLVANWRQLSKRNFDDQKTYLIQKAKHLINRVLSPLKIKLKIPVNSSGNFLPNSPNQSYEITYSNSIRLAQRNYKPKPYQGRVLLYFSHEGARTSWLYPRGGWGNLIKGEVEVDILSSDTSGLLIEPNVIILADKIKVCLDQVQSAMF